MERLWVVCKFERALAKTADLTNEPAVLAEDFDFPALADPIVALVVFYEVPPGSEETGRTYGVTKSEQTARQDARIANHSRVIQPEEGRAFLVEEPLCSPAFPIAANYGEQTNEA